MPNDDEQPPEYDGPEDTQTPAVLAMPKNAPPHLRMVLQTVSDQAQQQALIDCYNEMGPGLSQELFGQVGAYLSAILDHQIERGALGADELFAVSGQLRSISEEWGTALVTFEQVIKLVQSGGSSQPDAGAEGTPGIKAYTAQGIQMQRIVSAEVAKAVNAATAVQGRVLKIACLCCFLAGVIACALFIHWF